MNLPRVQWVFFLSLRSMKKEWFHFTCVKTKCVHYQDYFATADYTIKKKKKGAYTLSELSWPHTGPIGDGKYNILWIKRLFRLSVQFIQALLPVYTSAHTTLRSQVTLKFLTLKKNKQTNRSTELKTEGKWKEPQDQTWSLTVSMVSLFVILASRC